MPRPLKFRRVEGMPRFTYFKPRGIPLRELQEVILTVEEFEAIRLKDFIGFEQTEAAKKMRVHQSTFHRMIAEARRKIADALVNGKAIRVEGGVFTMPGGDGTGPAGADPVGPAGRGMGQGRGRGMGQGRGRAMSTGGRGLGGGVAAGPGGVCRCPSCGFEQAHQLGMPCTSVNCPKCKTRMVRV